MASLNKVQIIGNLGRDPEIRYTQDNRPIANVSVATTESWKGQDGQKQEKTEWHRVVVFGNLAGVIEKYLKKGDSVYFEGKLQTRKWTGQDGKDNYSTEVVIDRGGNMVMLGSRGGASMGDAGGYGQSAPVDNFDQTSPAGGGAPAGGAGTVPVSSEPAFDDEIPF
ncbi:MAG: single-stranded DNA-binding protein [Pseudomonadota bacterium]|nr:single-stranded DNA-binding protein [Pseudomonadota bacterium]